MKSMRAGFTIVELLIVIIVIAILASITVVAYNGVQERAEYAKAQTDMKHINDAIEVYASEHGGTYPPATMYDIPYTDQNGNSKISKSDFQWGNACTSNDTNTTQYHEEFLQILFTEHYLDKMPIGTCYKFGKHFSYSYTVSPDKDQYKLLRFTFDAPLPSVETSDNPLLNPGDSNKGSWGYWTPTWKYN